jgi:hypothetical protein
MHKTASLSEWYKEHGRHAVYAKGHEVPGIQKTRSLSLPVIAKVLEDDIDKPTVSPYLIEEEEIVGV